MRNHLGRLISIGFFHRKKRDLCSHLTYRGPTGQCSSEMNPEICTLLMWGGATLHTISVSSMQQPVISWLAPKTMLTWRWFLANANVQLRLTDEFWQMCVCVWLKGGILANVNVQPYCLVYPWDTSQDPGQLIGVMCLLHVVPNIFKIFQMYPKS